MAYVEIEDLKLTSKLSEIDINRIIEMAWEDRTTFDAIKFQFGLKESDVKTLMKNKLKFSSYKLWRKRVETSKTKHAKTRVNGIHRFKSNLQRSITFNKISKQRTK
ncbi:MAG: TIGR03643 family protein [Bacteroidetes bacterium]|nr:TIGR03643 family protein [Bacteroidota bacterium]